MRRLRMLEEQEVWKREAGFDRIEIIVQLGAQSFPTGFDSEPLSFKLYNPRYPHTPAKYTLEMNVDVGRLRIEILLSQPAPPPQFASSPRRSPPRSAQGWMDAECRALGRNQRRGKGFFIFKPVSMVFCTFAHVRNIIALIYFNQTSGWVTKKQHLLHKPLLARSLQNRRRIGSSKDTSMDCRANYAV